MYGHPCNKHVGVKKPKKKKKQLMASYDLLPVVNTFVFIIIHILAIYDINNNLIENQLKRIKNTNMDCTRKQCIYVY